MILREKIKNLPENPGVYLMKNDHGEILYIGKAICLKKRVRSYFTKAVLQNPKLESLVSQIFDIDYIITSSELEALILENTLIKKHKPKYNVVLRDDKNYPYLCLTINEEFPRLVVTRKVKKDGKLYFGPYLPASALKRTLNLIYQVFPLRQCRNIVKKGRPCLHHQMKRCGGPCTGEIDRQEYQLTVQKVKLFLLGKKQHLLKALEKQMYLASEQLNYEKAAKLRDQIQAVQKVLRSQNVFSIRQKNKDIIDFIRFDDLICFVIFFIRHGYLLGKKDFIFTIPQKTTDEEVISSFVKQFYAQNIIVPRIVILGHATDEFRVLEDWLTEKRGSKVEVLFPKKGEGKKQVEMVRENAQVLLQSYSKSHCKDLPDPVLSSLADELFLPKVPIKIEAFDISNFYGSEAVGSMVCWVKNKPARSEYRKFRIKNVSGIDDYAMMEEVLHRRYKRLLEEGKELPDLVLIDGGKGHLQAGLKVLKDLNITLPMVSLAKKQEEIFLPSKPFPLRLSRRSASLQLLQRIRDEAHRFAITYHRQFRKKNMLSSQLLEIKGVGITKKRALLHHFGSLSRIKEANEEELLKVPKLDIKTAQEIFRFFHQDKEARSDN